jgi:hypothetical protein
MGRERETGRMEEGAMEFTLEELREFLEGDRLDVRADPEFKERLRRRLWEMVRARTQRPEDRSD